MGIYANDELMQRFVSEYPKHCSRELDMGKICIRFKKIKEISFELIAELCRKMTPKDRIRQKMYANKFKKE